MKQKDKITHCC